MLAKALSAPFKDSGKPLIITAIIGIIPLLGAVLQAGIMVDYLKRVWDSTTEDVQPPRPSIGTHLRLGISYVIVTIMIALPLVCGIVGLSSVAVAAVEVTPIALVPLFCLFAMLVFVTAAIAPASLVVYSITGSIFNALKPSNILSVMRLPGYLSRWLFGIFMVAVLNLPTLLVNTEIAAVEDPTMMDPTIALFSLCVTCFVVPTIQGYIALFWGYLWGSLGFGLEPRAAAFCSAKHGAVSKN